MWKRALVVAGGLAAVYTFGILMQLILGGDQLQKIHRMDIQHKHPVGDKTAMAAWAAEKAWRRGRGFLWMQHSRKAGGTSLCMTLRENSRGMIKVGRKQYPLKQETCQYCEFCCDCDLKKKYPNPNNLHKAVSIVMNKTRRNFFEAEGFGVPTDTLTDNWSDWAFVSTLRHPLARIESSLRNDFEYEICHKQQNGTTADCLKEKFVGSDQMILDSCKNGIYHCNSNYFVRMFSGRELDYSTDRKMVELAKQKFKRFSCVVLAEEWKYTEICLGEKLGLLRTVSGAFNVNGEVKKLKSATDSRTQSITAFVDTKNESSLVATANVDDTISAKLLHPEEVERLIRLNKADLEFYEWAREQILEDAQSMWRRKLQEKNMQ